MATSEDSKRELEKEIIKAKTHYQVDVAAKKVKAFKELQKTKKD